MTVTTDIENARLAHGTELLGEYAGSGFKEPPYLVRRCDGQIVQLPRLLYAVAEQADGSRDDADLAADVSISVRRRLTAEQVRYLVDEKLRPLGIVAGHDDAPPPPGASLLFGLNVKKAVLQPDLVNVIAAILSPLFWPPVVAVVLLGVAGVDAWLFAVHGIAQGIRGALYDPAALLLLIALVLVATAFHECGHAAGTRYGGARPGAMGAGLYLVWPAFYTDISDSYRLSRGGRLRADLGGVYFNTVFMLGIAAAYWFTGFEPVLLLIPLQHIEVIHQLLPVLRLDGYYVLTDLTGVPDILSRIRPILKSLVPGYPNDRRVDELKPWVRVVVTAYVVTIVPLLLVLCGLMVVTAPRVFATAAGAFVAHLHAARHALDARLAVPLVVQALELVLLVLPPAGLAWTLLRLARRLAGGVWGATERRPRARNVLVAVTSIVATATFLNWWSTGAYRPIGKGDRGTVGSIAQLSWFHRHARPHPRAQRVHDAPPAPSLPAGRTPPPSRTATQPAWTRPDAPTTTSHTPLTTTSHTPPTTTSQTPAPSPHRANTPTNTRTSATTTTRATTTAPLPATTTAPETTTESTTTATTTTQTTTTQTATTTSP